MEGFFVLLGFAAIAAFFLGPIGFFLTLGARERLREALGPLPSDRRGRRRTAGCNQQ